ncbi:hypothetical protein VTL71DRAFT_12652, partial [Oculimacula yallundae]
MGQGRVNVGVRGHAVLCCAVLCCNVTHFSNTVLSLLEGGKLHTFRSLLSLLWCRDKVVVAWCIEVVETEQDKKSLIEELELFRLSKSAWKSVVGGQGSSSSGSGSGFGGLGRSGTLQGQPDFATASSGELLPVQVQSTFSERSEDRIADIVNDP